MAIAKLQGKCTVQYLWGKWDYTIIQDVNFIYSLVFFMRYGACYIVMWDLYTHTHTYTYIYIYIYIYIYMCVCVCFSVWCKRETRIIVRLVFL
jgi:hypothetical protein